MSWTWLSDWTTKKHLAGPSTQEAFSQCYCVFLLPPSPAIHGLSPLVIAAGANHCVSLVTPQRLASSLWQLSATPVPPKSCFFLCPHYWGPSLAAEPICSVQFSCSVVSNSLWHHALQHARLPCPSPTPEACSNSYPTSQWCHPTISFSVVPFSSCLQSFPTSGSFPTSQFFASGGQNIEVSASASVLPMNIQDWFPLGWTGWISFLSNGLSRVFFITTVQKHQFSSAQPSLWPNSHIHTWLLEKP